MWQTVWAGGLEPSLSQFFCMPAFFFPAQSCEIYISPPFGIPLSAENCTQFVLHNVKVGLDLVRNEFDWASVG